LDGGSCSFARPNDWSPLHLNWDARHLLSVFSCWTLPFLELALSISIVYILQLHFHRSDCCCRGKDLVLHCRPSSALIRWFSDLWRVPICAPGLIHLSRERDFSCFNRRNQLASLPSHSFFSFFVDFRNNQMSFELHRSCLEHSRTLPDRTLVVARWLWGPLYSLS